ncbi:hypothetical protein B0I37DRAFT_373963 [Chaetomium sp. MPI-CAGE-AT-0009]|nr:hypothetical protein B0I37DRAFT_373963 [Chaetomium sp. MPI-CAGE-AT-0009]
MWTDLLDIARDHWEDVTRDSSCRTQPEGSRRPHPDTGACMVAVLFVPSNSGAYFFLSTVPKHHQTEMRSKGYQYAPAWWTAVARDPRVYCHAEDAVEYDFERAFRSGLDRSLPYIEIVQSRNGTQYFQVQDRDNPHANPKLAVWGCYGDESFEEQQKGHFIELCSQSTKRPSCQDVARTLHIEYCTQRKLNMELEAIAASERSHRGARGAQGGAGPSSSGRRSGPSGGPHSSLPPSNMRPSGSGGHGSDVSHLSRGMSTLGVSSRTQPTRESARREPARKEDYWKWDSKRQEYYHRHSDGTVSVSKTGR